MTVSDISRLDFANLGPGLEFFAETAITVERNIYDTMSRLKLMSELEFKDWDVSWSIDCTIICLIFKISAWINPKLEQQLAYIDEFKHLESLFKGLSQDNSSIYLYDEMLWIVNEIHITV